MNIPGLHGLGIGKVLMSAAKNFIRNDMATYAAALAYQMLFSLFPFFIFLIALIGTLHLPDFMLWLREQAAMLLPHQAMDQVNRVLEQLRQPPGGLMSAGAFLALWTASAAARATMNAFNVAYRVEESRPIWVLYPLSVLYTVAVAALLIASAALLLVGPRAMEWLEAEIGFDYGLVKLWTWMRWPVAVILLSLSAAVVYYSAPAAQPRFPYVTPGAVLAVLIWALASLGFDYYVSHFANYNATYGSMGSVVLLLLYFYLSSAVLLYGAEINAFIACNKGENAVRGGQRPGTAGQDAKQTAH
ncbi:membrane protein [Noviherbaspirillum humi]|uniref:Membrane protein n=1 Tax=Noviherbaspirillum humi TaxID=1688639 RepID=A0A239LYP0_9BURK|nr:YihY/virulence factor BrkB family protein [Noviherbaspirillum humi]SNT35390.1 membrane protein [Noviherbaspirillum humi]